MTDKEKGMLFVIKKILKKVETLMKTFIMERNLLEEMLSDRFKSLVQFVQKKASKKV